jgi:hypothetical protein
MTPTPAATHIIGTLWWLLPLALIVGFFKMPYFKGLAGEVSVKLFARLFLDAHVYRAIHNGPLPN